MRLDHGSVTAQDRRMSLKRVYRKQRGLFEHLNRGFQLRDVDIKVVDILLHICSEPR